MVTRILLPILLACVAAQVAWTGCSRGRADPGADLADVPSADAPAPEVPGGDADAGPDAATAPWQAQWIGLQDESTPNQWIAFRTAVTLDKAPTTARVRMACDSKYWLWVNGDLVVFEGQLKRGPTPRDTYFDELDLAPHLRAGENTVAVLVWYWGKAGFSHNSSGRAGLVFELRADDVLKAGDAGWKVLRHPAYGDTDGRVPNFRLSEHNVRFDARLDIPGWTGAGFDDSAWDAATELGVPPTAPWNDLVARPIPQWRDSGLRDFVNAAALPGVSDGQPIVATLPYNAQVTPYLRITASAGLTIGIQTDNYLGGGTPNVRAEYVTREGLQEYESFGWMNGHDVRFAVPAGVTIHALKYRETGYDADSVGTFASDDPALDALWEKARRTLVITMRDNYMDCPDRERAQWWGDAVNELGESFYVFDAARGPLLARKAMRELANWRRADRTLYAPVPSSLPDPDSIFPFNDGTWSKELPAQMLASVGWYGFWTYYRHTGDAATIREVYPIVRDYMALWQMGPDGLVVHRAGDWDWTDWGDDIDVDVCENAWYVLALRGAVEMAGLTGNDADVAGYQDRLGAIRDHFDGAFWNGTAYRAPAYTGATDDRANALAVVSGLAGPERFPALREVFAVEQHASPYMEKYVLEALFQMDAPDQAMARMKQRFADQIASPLTTLWEGWGIGAQGYGGGTYNHAWSGGALTVLSQYAGGVAPTSPGWTTYRILPQMGALTDLRTVTPTPQGAITLAMTRGDAAFTATLDSPAGSVATFGLPRASPPWDAVDVDGVAVVLDGIARTVGGGRYLGEIDGRHAFELNAGAHRLEASAPALD